jgi:putative IMPACT (imprinted ancient) family translation regulator
MHVNIDYTWLGKLEKELRASVYPIKEIHYLDKVEIEAYVDEDKVQAFTEWMVELTNGQCQIKGGESVYLEEDYIK